MLNRLVASNFKSKYNSLVQKGQRKGFVKNQKRSFKFSTEGGRGSVAGVVCTVFGSTGYLGRHVVANFGSIGTQVVTPYRGDELSIAHLKVMGDLGQIVPMKWNVRNPDSVYQAVKHSDIVINLVGSKWDTRNYNLEEVNIDTARLIAEVSNAVGVDRLIHVSTTDYDTESECNWIKTKSLGEDAVKAAYPSATIIRPTTLYGLDDSFCVKTAETMKTWPFYPLIYPNKKHQPVFVNDVARAIVECVKNRNTIGNVYELGGNEIWTNEEIFNLFNSFLKLRARGVKNIEPILEQLSKGIQYLRNPEYTPDLMKKEKLDNVTNPSALGFEDIGIELDSLTSFNKFAPITIRRFRKPIRFDEGIEVTYSGNIIDPRDR